MLRRTIFDVLDRNRDLLMSLPNVNSVGIGYKNGKVHPHNLAIVVSVIGKKKKSELPKSAMVPQLIEGYQTDVIESDEFEIQ